MRSNHRGPSYLDENTLLAGMLGLIPAPKWTTGVTQRVLRKYGSFLDLIGTPQLELLGDPDIGPQGAAHFKRYQELIAGVAFAGINGKLIVGAQQKLIAFLRWSNQDAEQEQLRSIYLDHKCQVISEKLHYIGTRTFMPGDITEILRDALRANASSFVISHNHPAGTLSPSEMDIAFTQSLSEGAAVAGLNLYDHIILTSDGYYSFRSAGLLRPGVQDLISRVNGNTF